MDKKLILAIIGLLILVAQLIHAVSAYDDSHSFSYDESLEGNNRGFTISQRSTNQNGNTNNYCSSGAYYDWSSNGRYCRQTEYSNNQRVDRYYAVDNGYNDKPFYDQDKAIALAFKTFQASSKDKFSLEQARLRYDSERRNSRYGYGRSYSYYSWGW